MWSTWLINAMSALWKIQILSEKHFIEWIFQILREIGKIIYYLIINVMKKITKATLKSLAKKWELFWRIVSEFDGKTDWLESVQKKLISFSVKDIEKMWMTTNYLRRDSEVDVRLTNCCYIVNFNF